jgi:hypothetical protein
MKILWKRVFYFVMFLGSLVGFKNVVGQNDFSIITEIDKQNKHTISGHIYNNDTKSPLPFCNVILQNTNNDTIKTVQTDFNGYFEFELIPKGLYKIKVSFVDYLPHQIEAFEVNKDIKLKFDCSKYPKSEHGVTCYLIVSGVESDNSYEEDYPFRTYRDYNIDGKYRNRKPKNLR